LTHASLGALSRVIAVFSNEARDAMLVVLPASLIITVLAGRRRDPSLDLDLGAMCFAPFFVVRAVARVIAGGGHIAEGTLPPAAGPGSDRCRRCAGRSCCSTSGRPGARRASR